MLSRISCGSYIDRLPAGVFHSDSWLLYDIQIGSCHHQGCVATKEEHKQPQMIPQ